MTVSLIILATLFVVGAILWYTDRRSRKNLPPETPAWNEPEEACCGMHITCEKDSLLASVSQEIVYYDDEELDRFAGRSPESYTAEETEEFRDILLTLLPDDIAGWGRSIQLRGIQLPAEVREELLMIVAEARNKA